MKIKEEREVSDKNLEKAISIRFGRHYPAMSIMNALGGYPSTEWMVIRQFSPIEMIEEAMKRGIDVAAIVPCMADTCKCGECVPTVGETKLYEAAMKKIEERCQESEG